MGINLLGGRGVSWATVSADFLSNVPEALFDATGMKRAGYSTLHVLGSWGDTAASSVAAVLGYGYLFLARASRDLISFNQAFAVGAFLPCLRAR